MPKNGVEGASMTGSERSCGLSRLISWTLAVIKEVWKRTSDNKRKREETISHGFWKFIDGLLLGCIPRDTSFIVSVEHKTILIWYRNSQVVTEIKEVIENLCSISV